MRKRTGCWVLSGILILLLVVLAGGGWLWYSSHPVAKNTGPLSLVIAELTAPSSGEEVNLGDYVSIRLQAAAPNPIQKAELFVDGQSLGEVSDSAENAYWTWQALPAGVHTFYASATDSAGNVGQSQTVIVNVLAGRGAIQVPADSGQTLQQVGAPFGASGDQVAAANPHLDPKKPLEDGQQVNVPIPPGNAGGGQSTPPGNPGANGPPFITIIWNIKFNQPADQTYCYESTGNGDWDKLPKDPFTFFPGVDSLYTQLIPLGQKVEIQVQCWGWLGGVLKYLGDGKTAFDINQLPPNLVISAAGFQFTGTPKVPVPTEKFTDLPSGGFPPPYAMREPKDAADCTAHSNPILAGFICKTLLSAKLKENEIIEWEWSPGACWGPCTGVQAVDGYRLYTVDPLTKATTYVKQIDNPSQKITLFPLVFGEAPCYGVSAYVNSPAPQESDMATYCPGELLHPQLLTFKPTAWVTTGGQWIEDGDCSGFGGLEPYLAANQNSGFGNSPGVMVGQYIVDDSGCFRQGDYGGGVKFLPNLPPGGVLTQAILRYSTILMDYGSPGWASPKPASCLAGVNKSTVDWSALSTGDHYAHSPALYGPKYGSPITSLSQWVHQDVDVTSAVNDWITHPTNNRGLNLTPAPADSPKDDGYGRCLSGLGNFLLDVYYFAP